MSLKPSNQDGLKEAIVTLKDSGVDYIKSKSELAMIESKEAGDYIKGKLNVAVVALFVAIFTYAIFLILAHSLALSMFAGILGKMHETLRLTQSQIVLIGMLLIHLLLLVIFLMKLAKKPESELFALTKSELKKDQAWLREMNNNEN